MPGLEDIECAINEHFYRFCGELELEDFKKNTYKYSLSKIMRVPPP